MIRRGLVSSLGVLIGSHWVDGIAYDTVGSLVFAVALLAFFAAVLKPLLVLVALPLVVMTFGVAILFINAVLYFWVGALIGGFHVESFAAAFWGAFWVSICGLLFSGWINGGKVSSVRVRMGVPRGRGPRHTRRVTPRPPPAKDDVIDI